MANNAGSVFRKRDYRRGRGGVADYRRNVGGKELVHRSAAVQPTLADLKAAAAARKRAEQAELSLDGTGGEADGDSDESTGQAPIGVSERVRTGVDVGSDLDSGSEGQHQGTGSVSRVDAGVIEVTAEGSSCSSGKSSH